MPRVTQIIKSLKIIKFIQVCLGLESKLLTTMLVSIKGNVPKAVVSIASIV